MSEGIVPVEPAEDIYSVSFRRDLEQLLQVLSLPDVVGVEPRHPLCLYLGQECAASPTSAFTLLVIHHYDRSRSQRLCHSTCQGFLEAAMCPESRWVSRDANGNTWA